jgi:hypothetical protein
MITVVGADNEAISRMRFAAEKTPAIARFQPEKKLAL